MIIIKTIVEKNSSIKRYMHMVHESLLPIGNKTVINIQRNLSIS
jgi:hypothetical protein